MNTIKRDVYVLRNTIKIPIEVTKGTDAISFEFTVRDYNLPATAAAVAYAYRMGMKKPNSTLCDVSGNVISFQPSANFFGVGNNELQIRVINEDKSLISFKERVKCSDAMGFPDDDAENQKTLVEQILAKTGQEAGERKTADEKEKQERIEAINTEKAGRIAGDAREKSERQAEIATERARINQFTKLAAGSTTGDAELIDGRTDVDGEVHENIGDAMRGQARKLREDLSQLSEEIVEHSELLCDYPYKFVNSVTTGKPIEGSAEIEDNIYYFCSDNMYIGSENTLSVEFINTTGKDLYIVIDRCDSNGLVNKIGSTFTVLNGDTWNYVFKDKYDYVKFHGRTTDMKSVENILGVIKTGFKIIIKNYEQKILEDYKGISHSNVIERLMSDEAILSSVENKISNMSILNVLDIGCKNDGVTNNSPILNQILDTKENITLYFPKGDYKINNTIIMYNSNLLLDNGARIFTENELPYLVSVNPYTEETGKYKYGVSIKNFIKGGCFDGCDVAYNIIGLEHYTNFTIDDVKIYNFRNRGIECATDRNKQSTTISHGGLMVSHCLIRNWTDTGKLDGTVGIDNSNASDNKFFDNTIVNCQIGIDTNFAIISRIHHWISFVNILPDSVFVRNKNSFTTISDCSIDTVCCAVQSIGNQTRIINSTMFFNPLFVDENTFACFAKHGVSSGYVYAINCLFYMPTGRAKVSDYDTSNFPDKYLMCRFTPEENFDLSNYSPLL